MQYVAYKFRIQQKRFSPKYLLRECLIRYIAQANCNEVSSPFAPRSLTGEIHLLGSLLSFRVSFNHPDRSPVFDLDSIVLKTQYELDELED